jgi:hypothetical protein
MVARMRWRWCLPLVLVFAACADAGGSGAISERDMLVSDLAAEINTHYATIERASSMTEAQAELDRHAAAMRDLQAQLGAAVPRLRCTRETTGLETALEERVTEYLEQAAQAPTLAELRRLCLAYANDAHEIFKLTDDRCLSA